MNHFHLYNQQVFKEYLLCDKENPGMLSYPLLVSPEYINTSGKILCIGQETNTWGNHFLKDVSVDDLEDLYASFLKKGATNRPYWKFIKEVTADSSLESIVWSNLLLCGKRDTLGTPEVSENLFHLSEEYLYHLYKECYPCHVMILSSPHSVYANLIQCFFENIDCHMSDTLSSRQPVLINEDKKVIWTYHPKYLTMSKQIEKVKTICKNYISK